MMALYSIRLLRYVKAVAETRSFSRPAAGLGTSQPVLSSGIRRLEQRLGFTLFSRDGGNIALTPQGAEFLPHAAKIIASADRFGKVANAIRSGSIGGFRFGYPPYFDLMPEVGAIRDQFTEDHPEIAIQIHTAFTFSLTAGLLSREYDVALLLGRPESPQLETFTSRRLIAKLLIPAESPLAGRDAIGESDWAGLSLCGPERSHSPIYFDQVIAPLIARGVRLLPAQAPSFPGLLRHAQHYRLPTLAFPDLVAPTDLQMSDMILKPIANANIGVDICLTIRAGEANSSLELMKRNVRRYLTLKNVDIRA
ncbi:MAG TPA: LysR family transcriptional regulator [Sphingobium sp.]